MQMARAQSQSPREKWARRRSGDGVQTLLTNATVNTVAGPLLRKIAGNAATRFGSGEAEATEVVAKTAGRGARNPKVAKALAEGRAKHAELAEKVRAKPGYKSEPSLKDPSTGNTVRPDVVTRGGSR